MTTASNYLQPFVCPGHRFVASVHRSREDSKDAGAGWISGIDKDPNVKVFSCDYKKVNKKSYELICSYTHIDNYICNDTTLL